MNDFSTKFDSLFEYDPRNNKIDYTKIKDNLLIPSSVKYINIKRTNIKTLIFHKMLITFKISDSYQITIFLILPRYY